MKIIFLNTWGGKVESLKDFILDQSVDTYIFCFQEAAEKNNWLFENLLSQYHLIADRKAMVAESEFFQATYINKTLKINVTQTLLQKEHDSGLCLYTQIKNNLGIINVCNVHGIAYPGDKLDNPGRLKQSFEIINFLKNINGPKIIGGDFNLGYDTQSVKMFEENGYRNLIKEFKISTTRNELAWRKFKNKQLFADYIFVSPDIKIKKFSVPNIEISDHLPLILEFSL